MNTTLRYLYRDGDNYKISSSETFVGVLDEAMTQAFRAHLDLEGGGDIGSFIPGQVGLADLQDKFLGPTAWDPERDHPWHEVLAIEKTDQPATTSITVAEFLEQVLSTRWNAEWLPAFAREEPDAQAEPGTEPQPA